MPNIDIKAILLSVGREAVAVAYGVANRHLADSEQADCLCPVHREAAKLEATRAAPPAKSRGSRGASAPPTSPKSRKAPTRAKGE